MRLLLTGACLPGIWLFLSRQPLTWHMFIKTSGVYSTKAIPIMLRVANPRSSAIDKIHEKQPPVKDGISSYYLLQRQTTKHQSPPKPRPVERLQRILKRVQCKLGVDINRILIKVAVGAVVHHTMRRKGVKLVELVRQQHLAEGLVLT